jgi:hypothetical protein
MSDPRYPIGKFQAPPAYDAASRETSIRLLEDVPRLLRLAVQGLTPAQLDTPYRDGGWTIRQVVHHLADSHMNAYVRFKLALTEETPTIKPYNEKLWANLPDSAGEIDPSLTILDGMHRRWIMLLRSMDAAAFSRTLRHPENGINALDRMLALYSWHGGHHLAQITGLRERNGW